MTTKFVAIALSAILIFAGFTSQVSAAVIGTQQALSIESRNAQIGKIQAQLARADVQQAMIDMGVDPSQAQLRVASLSDQELVQLNGQLEQLPAGGEEVLVVIGIVFLVLILLEITGVIDIFKKN